MSLPRLIGLPGFGAWGYLARLMLARREIPGFPRIDFKGPLVMVCGGQEELEDVADSFRAFAPLFDGAELPLAFFGEDPQIRLASLERLKAGAPLMLATAEALAAPTFSRAEFESKGILFKRGAALPRTQVMARLVEAGYRRVDFVESPGEFAVRGAILDFFGLEPLQAVRVLYEEDVIDSLRIFDPATQTVGGFVDSANAVAATQPGAGPQTALSEWVGENGFWVVQEGLPVMLPAGAQGFEAGKLLEGSGENADFGARPHSPCRGNLDAACAEMRARAQEGFRVVLYSLNRGEDRRIQEILEDKLPAGLCQFVVGPLQQGFLHAGLKLAVWTTSEIFDRQYRSPTRWKFFSSSSRAAFRWAELRQGDYVVHQDYGLARYKGLKPIDDVDCLALGFRGSDVLYVPMTDFQKVQRYSGAEGHRPRLASLDTRTWDEVKHMVQEGVREMAEALLKVQAERAALPGHEFPPESAMERELAEAFPYEETPDQTRAIADVLGDMMTPHPMDRIVVGDVGFGKTEVAMRAAFKCVMGFKQAAVLVPTTILADQHFRTFSARFADYPVRLGILSRFQKEAQQKKTIEALAAGKVDIIVGTSRLLSKDIRFKDLGLTIIDEEHRFGVKDKERLKQIRRTVDCLALSATPIPRSLNQAFAGLRAISLIESPPLGRQPIVTTVAPWSEERVAAAIGEELARGGQAYYVHNRVRTLPQCVEMLSRLAPQARLAMVHGQMKGDEIEEVMWDFFNRKYDVLVASTIIESGLDIPTVNTMLVEDAHEFGLAQLYQLRGRIGRERQRAYCTLFFPPAEGTAHLPNYEFSHLTEDARKRLEALREFAELGTGVKLAMRDLEIRGAGDLLGAKQHGFMNAVGIEYYTELLNEEIARRKGRAAAPSERPVQLDIKLSAFIPEDYLPGELERLEFYKKILRSKPEESETLKKELIELSGPLPPPVKNLFDLLGMRGRAQKAGVRSVIQSAKHMEVWFYPDRVAPADAVARWTQAYAGKLRFLHSGEGDGIRVELDSGSPLAWLETFLGK